MWKDIKFTLSKIGGLILITGGLAYGFVTKDGANTAIICGLGAGLMATKNVGIVKKEK
jgi:hypothetical protein